MKKFKFDTWIVETRKRNYSQLLLAIGALSALFYNLYNYFQFNRVEVIDWFIDLFRLFGSANIVYWSVFIGLFLIAVPGIYQLFRKKVVKKGYVKFDEEKLTIVKGREQYEIPEAKLSDMRLELKKLPDPKKRKLDDLAGGNYMVLPMNDGEHRFEIHVGDKKDRQELLDMAEFLKIQHDIKVKVKEIK